MAAQIPALVDPAFYHQVADVVWNAFGVERLIYASNWPQIEHVSDFATEHRIVACYFSEKGAEAEEKFFWRNAKRVYGWRRDAFSGTQLLEAVRLPSQRSNRLRARGIDKFAGLVMVGATLSWSPWNAPHSHKI